MSRSSAEQEIRDAVVARLRVLMPGARIVHELNVAGTGTNRIDVAAIEQQAIVAVEIKSEKDKLDRLSEQWAAFKACCHHVVVAAHLKHFAEHRPPYLRAEDRGEMNLNHPLFFGQWWHRSHVWQFPVPERGRYGEKPWSFNPHSACRTQPRAVDMLSMLWAEELRAESGFGSRAVRDTMIHHMAWTMTGREICEAVCRQLRARPFTEADAPIIQTRAAA